MVIALSQFSDKAKDNPYVWSLGSALRQRGFDVRPMPGTAFFLFTKAAQSASTIHFQWFEALIGANSRLKMLLKILVFILQLKLCRTFGKRLVWTLHNVASHESKFPKLEYWAVRQIGKHADTIIVHCNDVKAKVSKYLAVDESLKVQAIDHGNYIGAYKNSTTRIDARRQLNIPDDPIVVLFLGNIRPYKGLDDLIVAFNSLDLPEAKLLIAGKPLNDEVKGQIEKSCNDNPNIIFHPRFIDDDFVQYYFHASDAVALPYRKILASGAAILAMSFGKVCIAPTIGCMQSLADASSNFLYNPKEKDGLRNAIEQVISARDRLGEMGEQNLNRARTLDWDRIACETAELYR